MTATPAREQPWATNLAYLGKPRTEDVFGDKVTRPTVDDVAVGWSAFHSTDRYLEGNESKGGAVYDVTERNGRRFVAVVEAREMRGKVALRWYEWDVAALDPERVAPLRDGEIAGYVVAMLRFGVQSMRRMYDYELGDRILIAIYALTDPGRKRIAAASAARAASGRCAAGHCTDKGGECADARDHLGVCCFCSEAVPSRRGGKVAAR